MQKVWALLVLSLPVVTASPVRALDITTCGVTVPPGEIGALQADLVCAGGNAVELQSGATLDLNAHVLTLADPGAVVWCSEKSCTVRSAAAARGRIVGTYESSCVYGIDVVRRVVLENVEISHCEGGVNFRKARVWATDVDVSDCSYFAMLAQSLDLLNVTMQDTGEYGPGASKAIRGKNVRLTNCGEGVYTDGRVRIDGLVAQGNTEYAVYSGSLGLENSALSGNSIDFSTSRRPRLLATSCDRSERHDPFGTEIGTWGVCALD